MVRGIQSLNQGNTVIQSRQGGYHMLKVSAQRQRIVVIDATSYNCSVLKVMNAITRLVNVERIGAS